MNTYLKFKAMKEKSLFESRISFSPGMGYKGGFRRVRVYYATVFWNDTFYETTKRSKELCIADLKRKAGIK